MELNEVEKWPRCIKLRSQAPLLAPSTGQRNARIVTTTLLLTEEVMREDRGSEGSYVLYGSSCAELTEEAEYVKKQHPLVPGRSAEPRSSGWSSSCSPVAAKMRETEQQLLLVSRENQLLRIKLEATREAGVQALRAASQKLYESYQARSEELCKTQEKEKQQIQARSREQEGKLQQQEEKATQLAGAVEERCACIAAMEQRVRRMEEEKKTLMEKKTSYEKMLLQMMSRNEDSKRCLAVQQDIATLREQIGHLQRLIGAQHQSLRRVIQEVRLRMGDAEASIAPKMGLLWWMRQAQGVNTLSRTVPHQHEANQGKCNTEIVF
uniref:Coiled-coil domain containing 68 n=1 Tax=Anas platyrhynchos TaxID=8839 RepID=A0A8B9TIK9_ANAPL